MLESACPEVNGELLYGGQMIGTNLLRAIRNAKISDPGSIWGIRFERMMAPSRARSDDRVRGEIIGLFNLVLFKSGDHMVLPSYPSSFRVSTRSIYHITWFRFGSYPVPVAFWFGASRRFGFPNIKVISFFRHLSSSGSSLYIFRVWHLFSVAKSYGKQQIESEIGFLRELLGKN